MQNKLHHDYISECNIIVMLLLKSYSFFLTVAFFFTVAFLVAVFAVFVVFLALLVVVLPSSFTSSGVQTSPFLGLFQDI